MANEKLLQTRISLKYDTYANWTNTSKTDAGANLVLKKGEVGFCEIPAGNATATNAPTVLFKVGDGTRKFSELNWASALAADVHAWAKKSEAEFLAWVKGLVPIEVIDPTPTNGKFITKVEATSDANGHHITITRSDVDWNDVKNKPNFVNSVKATTADDVVVLTPETAASGDVTITGAHAKKGPSAGYTGSTNIKGGTAVVGTELDIKVPVLTVDAYGHTNAVNEASYKITIPKATAPNDGELTLKAKNGLTATEKVFTANDTNDVTFEVSHADTSDASNLVANGRKYVTGLTFDDYGHVTGYTTGTEADQDLGNYYTKDETYNKTEVDNLVQGAKDYADLNDANTEYHVEYDSTNKKIKLVAGADATKMEIDATAFIKDGMIETVELVQEDASGNKGQFLKLTWNDDGKDVTYVPVGELVDVYTAEKNATEVQVAISNTNEVSATLVNKGVTEEKLEQDVQDALALARTALQPTTTELGVSENESGQAVLELKNGATAISEVILNGANGIEVEASNLNNAKTIHYRIAPAVKKSIDEAVQSASFAGAAFTKTGTALSISQADARTALGLGTAAYKAEGDFATKAQGELAETAVQKSQLGAELYMISSTLVGDVFENNTQLVFDFESKDENDEPLHWPLVALDLTGKNHIVLENGEEENQLTISTDITDATADKAGLVKLGAQGGAATYADWEATDNYAHGYSIAQGIADIDGHKNVAWFDLNNYLESGGSTIRENYIVPGVGFKFTAIKVSGNEQAPRLDIDDTITWIFDCGGAGV